MKPSYFWVIIVFLLGICAFGITKSVELAARNAVLSHDLGALKTKLDSTQQSLTSTRQALGESYLKSAELEGRLAALEQKAVQQAEAIRGHLKRIDDLSAKLAYTARANAAFSAQNKELNDRLLREKLEADEMRHKLSSVVELKKAIRELKISMRQARRNKKTVPARAQARTAFDRPREKAALRDEQEDGNNGFLIRDGRSTFQGLVDIRVMAAEQAAGAAPGQ